MKNLLLFFVFFWAQTLIFSQNNVVVADKIIYKVIIKNDSALCKGCDNIEPSIRSYFSKKIFEDVYSGKLKAYKDEDFRQQIPLAELKNFGNRTQSITIPNPNKANQDTTIIVTDEFDTETIGAMMFMEQWYYNPANGQLSKKIIAVAPLQEYILDSGEASETNTYKMFFWIKMPN